MAPLENMKQLNLIITPEFISSGILNKDLVMVDYEELSLPSNLVKEFNDWLRFYEVDCHRTHNYLFQKDMAEELNIRGRAIAKKVKKIYPESSIRYRGEDAVGILVSEEITDA
jgi:hypothetical protein